MSRTSPQGNNLSKRLAINKTANRLRLALASLTLISLIVSLTLLANSWQTVKASHAKTEFSSQPNRSAVSAVVNFSDLAARQTDSIDHSTVSTVSSLTPTIRHNNVENLTTDSRQNAVKSPVPVKSFAAAGGDISATRLGGHTAVGGDQLMVAFNQRLYIQSKTGEILSVVSMRDFWASLAVNQIADTRLLYDQANRRWIITAQANSAAGHAAILVGVSQTEDATANWNIYQVAADAANQLQASSLSIGLNSNWIVVQANLPEATANLFLFNKADLYAGGSGLYTLISARGIGGNLTPAVSYDNSGDFWLVQTTNNHLALYTITGALGAESLMKAGVVSAENANSRIENLVLRNGSLWCAQTVSNSNSIQWWQLATDSSVKQQGRIDPTGKNRLADPTVAVNQQGDLLIGYAIFTGDRYVGSGYSVHAASDPLNSMRESVMIKVGDRSDQNSISASSAIVDANNQAFWLMQPFTVNTNVAGSGLWLTEIEPAAAPSISNFAPTSGPFGTRVVIAGSGFTGATAVSFNGTAATSFTVDSDNQITATVPTGATTGPISVTTPAGTFTTSNNFTVLPIGIISFSPTGGPIGTSVVITGSGFTGATSVSFNGTAATTVNVDSDTQITATVPTGATTGPITIVAPAGTTTSTTNFTIGNPPTITAISPTSGPVGTTVTITGTNLTNASQVTFNGGRATTFTATSATQIMATVPPDATTGPVMVITPTGTATSATNFIISQPTISGFSPTAAPVGATIMIFGTNLTGATGVSFNGTAATTVNVVSNTQINAVVPTGASSGVLSVTTPGGTASSTMMFTVASAATISGFTPMSGPPGTTVVIFGTNFTGATGVSFNGTAATTFTVNSGTQITATVPNGASTGPIVVTTPAGAVTSTATFTVPASATISGFAPATGAPGTTVMIFGTDFTGATAVRFNGTSANFTVVSATQINATVPNGATTGPITITTAGGAVTSSTNFVVPAGPVISGFAPTSGAVGTSVNIFGTNLTGTTAVQFNGVNANFTIVSATQVTATVPAGAATGPITVITPGGTLTSTSNFVVPAPTISAIAPTSGPVGTTVMITGSGLSGTTSVSFNGANAASFMAVSDTVLNAVVPANATTGPITITAANGVVTSPVSFTVLPAPTLISFSPTSGAAGTTVTITGANFTGATAVNFGNTAATNFSVLSDTQISAVVPAGAVSGAITVVTPNGTVTSTTTFTVDQPNFTIDVAPASLTLKRKQTGTVVVNINRSGGFTGTVTVTAPNLASTMKIVITPQTQNATGNSVSFNIKTKKKTPRGQQLITFTATDQSGITRTATLTLIVP